MKIQKLTGNGSTFIPGRGRAAKAVLIAGGLFLSMAAQAQVVISEETFTGGLGNYTAAGSVTVGSSGASMAGSGWSTDGAISSKAISTQGFTALKLSFDRATNGLDFGESGIAEFSTDGSSYTVIESIRTASGRVTFNLPAATENQAGLRLRFRVNASESAETYRVDNIRLEGTSSSTTPPPGGEPPPSTGGFQKGPDPTKASLEASTGPFTYTTTTVSSSAANGYGGGTIYHPTNVAGSFAAIAVAPGFTENQSHINWWGPRLASHGFVVITIDTKTGSDQPDSRATQLMAALNQLKTFNTTSSHPIYGKVDPNRMGVMGHSMGGGGTLIAARDNPGLKAAIPFAPWNSASTDFSKVTVPTLIIACEGDTIASVDQHASPFYESIPTSVKKAYLEINDGDHSCANSGNSFTAMNGKYGVSWMKRFMDEDTRYSPYLCGAPHKEDLANTAVISEYRETCPY